MVSRTARNTLFHFTLLYLANFVLLNASLQIPLDIGPSQQLLYLLSLCTVPLPCHSNGCCMHQNYYVKLTSVRSQCATIRPSNSHDLLGWLTSACRCTLFTPKCPIQLLCRTKDTRPGIVLYESEWERERQRKKECASVNKVSHLTRKQSIKVVTCCYSVQCVAWVSHTCYKTMPNITETASYVVLQEGDHTFTGYSQNSIIIWWHSVYWRFHIVTACKG